VFCLLAASCVQPPVTPEPVCPVPSSCPVCPTCPQGPQGPPVAPLKPEPAKVRVFEPVEYTQLPGWADDGFEGFVGAMRFSCVRLRARAEWQDTCRTLASLSPTSAPAAIRALLEAQLTPWRISTAEGNTEGLLTGYFEPMLRGSRTRQGPYQIPLYGPPDDLLTIDLGELYPELRTLRLRGRLDGRRVVPYPSRADIERGVTPLRGKEIVWVDSAIEAFFLEIQGSGRVRLPNGELLRLGYADQNGRPYVAIGRVLIDRGELKAGEVTMQSIMAWARDNPAKLPELLAQNPSYVFFRELPKPSGDPSLGAPGAMGAALTPGRSIAIDPRFIPLGSPVFLSSTLPESSAPLNRLVLAQDTGGAIRGAVRADYYWGFGAEAGERAGRMRQPTRFWLLWPKGFRPPEP
jgi:membrane-bound lytic murein transglycosylase A